MTKSRKKTKRGTSRRGNSTGTGSSYARLSYSELRMMLAYKKSALESLNSQIDREKGEIAALESQIASTPVPSAVFAPAKASPGRPAAAKSTPGRKPVSAATKTAKTKPGRVALSIPSGNYSTNWAWKQKIVYIIKNGGGKITSADMLAFFKKNERGYNEKKYRNILSQYLLSMKSSGELKAVKAKVGRGYTYQVG